MADSVTASYKIDYASSISGAKYIISSALTSISYSTSYKGEINSIYNTLTATLMYYHVFGSIWLSEKVYNSMTITVTFYVYYV